MTECGALPKRALARVGFCLYRAESMYILTLSVFNVALIYVDRIFVYRPDMHNKLKFWMGWGRNRLGHECGMVFLAGVEPDLPSRDGTTWLSTRFSRSVDTWWRFGSVRTVFTRCAFYEL